jgi:hypothetical protein
VKQESPSLVEIVYNPLGVDGEFIERTNHPVGSAEKDFIHKPNGTAVERFNDAFLGNGALDAAKGPASRKDTQSITLPILFYIAGEPIKVSLKPENFSDALFSLYTAGAWDWAEPFLAAVRKALFPLDTQRDLSQEQIARINAFLKVAPQGITDLNKSIANALVELARSVVDKAQQLATQARAQIESQKATYGIVEVDTKPATGGTEGGPGGGGAGSGNEGSGGGGGNSDKTTKPVFGVPDPNTRAAAADLVAAIQKLATAYSQLEKAQLDFQNTASAEPYSGAPPSQDVTAAHHALSKLLKAVAVNHPLASGILALCLPQRSSEGALDEQTIYDCTLDYVAQAEDWLASLSRTYDYAELRNALARPTYSQATALGISLPELGISLPDTPETRAAVFSGRTDRGVMFEPLVADQILDRVRHDIVAEARTSPTDDRDVWTIFMLTVLNSYIAVADARDVIPEALAAIEEKPMQVFNKVLAALSLVGLLVPPVFAAVQASRLAEFALFGNALIQLDQVARLNSKLNRVALDALLVGDAEKFALTIASKPRATDVMADIMISFIGYQALGKMLPPIALAVQAFNDGETLLE